MTADDRLIDLLAAALRPAAGDVERLSSTPRLDQRHLSGRFGGALPPVRDLHAWLYAPDRRTAYAVHTPGWSAPAGELTRVNWDALLHNHFHAHFHTAPGSGPIWTEVGAVAIPLLPPFDERGLKVQPVLALRAAVASGGHHFSEAMTMSVRRGEPHVTSVLVFSGAMFVAHQRDQLERDDRLERDDQEVLVDADHPF